MAPNLQGRLRQLETIDSEINSLKASFRESLRVLSRRRNELVPISSLPTEIITEIILLASAQRRNVRLAWLNVAHICHQWREIVLNQPLFWSHINVTNLTSAGAAEMLTRAKEVPLHWREFLQPPIIIGIVRSIRSSGPISPTLAILLSPGLTKYLTLYR